MRALMIEFAPRTPLTALHSASPMVLAGIVLGTALTLGALIGWQQLPALPVPAPPTSMHQPTPAPTLSAAQAEVINRAVLQLNLPWRDLFDALEATPTTSVALLELSPDAGNRRLTGKAEADNSDAMLDYLARLQQQPFFGHVLLVRHERQPEQHERPLSFVFEAHWGGSAR